MADVIPFRPPRPRGSKHPEGLTKQHVDHGEVHEWPEGWGPSPLAKGCDWGDCDGDAVLARYDAHGHGWLPVCATCAYKDEP